MAEKTDKKEHERIFSEHPIIATLLFLILGMVSKVLSSMFLPMPAALIVPVAAVSVLTLFFHYVLDANKLNFLAKGHGIEGVVKGFLWGLFIVFYPVLFEIGAKNITFFYTGDLDLYRLLDAFCDGIFTSLLIFGYPFLVLRTRKGLKFASLCCCGLFCFYIQYFRYDYILRLFIEGFNPFDVTACVSIIVMSGICALMIFSYGDVRAVLPYVTVIFTATEVLFGLNRITFAGRVFTNPLQLFQILPAAVLLIIIALLLFTQRHRHS